MVVVEEVILVSVAAVDVKNESSVAVWAAKYPSGPTKVCTHVAAVVPITLQLTSTVNESTVSVTTSVDDPKVAVTRSGPNPQLLESVPEGQPMATVVFEASYHPTR